MAGSAFPPASLTGVCPTDRFAPSPSLGATIPAINPIYSIGIPEMDAQHAVWIALIHEFKSVAADELHNQERVVAATRALDELLNYTASHFASEERLLARYGYPELESHRHQHQVLTAAVSRLRDQVNTMTNGNVPIKLDLLAAVWLLEHITQDDLRYARFILKRAPGAGYSG